MGLENQQVRQHQNIQVNQKSFNKKTKKCRDDLVKVKEQDGMTLAKVRHAQVSHATH